MASITEKQVLELLSSVKDPELHETLVNLGMIKNIHIDSDNNIQFHLMLTTIACPLKEFIKDECITALKKSSEIKEITIIFGEQILKRKKNTTDQLDTHLFDGVKHVIMVASGKGGVGKTTVAVNLALALQKLGARVGILDTDIYGPNVPNMLGNTTEKPILTKDGNKDIMTPLTIQGVKVLSMDFFISKEQPVLWRGPMLNSIVQQFLFQTHWGELEYLVIDTPPGTGDVQMSLSQLAPVDGVLLVSTAQNASILDLKRSISQFEKLNLPIIGLVENMSYFTPDDAPDKKYDLFGSNDGKTIETALELPILAKLPFSIKTREMADKNTPVILEHPESCEGLEFMSLARKVIGKIAQERFKQKQS